MKVLFELLYSKNTFLQNFNIILDINITLAQ